MIKWSGWLTVFYGAAHLFAALTVEGAAAHAGAWFSGALWREDLASMSAAGSALWLSLDSFAIPLVVVGLVVLWLEGQRVIPPRFIGLILGAWATVDAAILPFTPWPVMFLASVLLLTGIRRAKQRAAQVPVDDVGASRPSRPLNRPQGP